MTKQTTIVVIGSVRVKQVDASPMDTHTICLEKEKKKKGIVKGSLNTHEFLSWFSSVVPLLGGYCTAPFPSIFEKPKRTVRLLGGIRYDQ